MLLQLFNFVTVDEADPHITACTIDTIRNRVEYMRKELAHTYDKIGEYLQDKVISEEESQIFYNR